MGKFFTIMFKVLALKILLGLSFVFVLLPIVPGRFSNIVAWLETDGATTAIILGSCFFLLIVSRILIDLRLFSATDMTVHRGIFHSTIKEGVFTELVQKLWNEYFQTSGLSVHTRLSGSALSITGDVPNGEVDIQDLSAVLAKKLLHLTGFFGKLTVRTQAQKK